MCPNAVRKNPTLKPPWRNSKHWWRKWSKATLASTCQQALKDAEQKVQILLKKSGQETLEPFDSESS